MQQVLQNSFQDGLALDITDLFRSNSVFKESKGFDLTGKDDYFALTLNKGVSLLDAFPVLSPPNLAGDPATLFKSPWQWSATGVGILWAQATPYASVTLTPGQSSNYLYKNINVYKGQVYTIDVNISSTLAFSARLDLVSLNKNGLNDDGSITSVNVSSPNTFYSFNFTATQDGFLAFKLTNLSGSTSTLRLTDLVVTRNEAISQVPKVVKSFPVVLSVLNGTTLTKEEGAILFAVQNDYLCIYAQRKSTGQLYRLYKELIEFPSITNYYIDGIVYPELGEDYIYFTDGVKELRKLICSLNLNVGADYIKASALSLLKRAPSGRLDLDINSVTATGTLTPGAYQYVIRLVNKDTKVSTKFCTPSVPVYVYGTNNNNTVSNKAVNLKYTTSTQELELYDQYQLGVIEFIDKSGTVPEVVRLLTPQDLTSTEISIVHKSNNYDSTISVAEATVPTASIFTSGTLSQSQNRLIGGNVTYANLKSSALKPRVTGQFVKQPLVGGYGVENNANKYRSAFRGELYRYYSVYYDEFGNFGAPEYLDMSRITDNQAQLTVDNNQFNNSNFNLLGQNWSTYNSLGTTNWGFASQVAFTSTIGASGGSTYGLGQPIAALRNKQWGVKVNGELTTISGNTSFQLNLVFLNNNTVVTSTQIYSFVSFTPGATYPIDINTSVVAPSIYYDAIAIQAVNSGIIDVSGVDLYQFQVGDAVKDLLYPKRGVTNGVDNSLLDSSSRVQALGVRMSIRNHPSWAKGFLILRAKRKAKVLSQSPVIPLVEVSGIGAAGPYPSKALINDPPETKTFDTAQPQPRSLTLFPASLGMPTTSDILFTTSNNTKGTSEYFPKQDNSGSIGTNNVQLFIDSYLYEDRFDKELFNGANLSIVDAVLLKAKKDNSTTSITDPTIIGALSGPNLPYISQYGALATTFYAIGKDFYWFGSTGRTSNDIELFSIAQGTSTSKKINNSQSIPALSTGTVLNGKALLQYKNLETQNAEYGVQPFVYKSNAFSLDTPYPVHNKGNVSNGFSYTFGANHIWSPNLTFWLSIGGVNYYNNITLQTVLSNKTIIGLSDFTEARPVKLITIANVENDYNDLRYGGVYEQHDLEITGAQHVFSESELYKLNNNNGDEVTVTLDVYGGDCFIAPHVFKLSNRRAVPSHLSAGAAATSAISRYGRAYQSGGEARPVTFSGNIAETIQVYLESTYNGAVVNNNIYNSDYKPLGADYPTVYYEPNTSADSIPTYSYNINYSQTTGVRIFTPFDDTQIDTNVFPCRLFWTDIKLYNTVQKGFDTIKAGSIYDIPELHKKISKVDFSQNNFYAICEKGVIYLPIGNKVIEQGNANTLQVRSEDVIGQHIILDPLKGAANVNSVVDIGDNLVVLDSERKDLYSVSGTQLQSITGGINSFIRDNTGDSDDLRLALDPKLKQVILYNAVNTNNIRFNYEIKKWLGNIGFTSGSRLPQHFYILGDKLCTIVQEVAGVRSYELYTAAASYGDNDSSLPYVKFVVTDPQLASKVFDNLVIDESTGVDSIKVDCYINTASVISHTFVVDANNSQELDGKLRVVIPPYLDNKLRGKKMDVTIYFKKGFQAVLASVLTKVTLSYPRL